MVDTHCHLYDDKIRDRAKEIIDNFQNDNLDFVIVPSCDMQSMEQALQLGQFNEKVYTALAVHPHSAIEFNDECEQFICKNASDDKVVAIGEFGFDYFYNLSPWQKQIEVAERHIELCNQCDLPAIFHIRDGDSTKVEHYDAYADFWNLVKNCDLKRSGVLHCFGGDKEKAKKALDMGFFISLTCNVTYKSNEHLREVVKYAPIDRLLIETDSPYMSPKHQRSLPNVPKNVQYVAECFAELKNMSLESVCEQTTINAKNLFFKIK